MNKDATDRRHTATDDAIIGKAFRWSLALLVAVAALAGLGIYLTQRSERVAAPVEETTLEGPRAPTDPATHSPPAVRFTDITEAAGIDFVHVNGASGDKLLPETMGGGVALFDYDNDGDQDLLFVNGDFWPGHVPTATPRPTMALYRNDGGGRFGNVTANSGLDVTFYGMGVAVGDYDNDGWVDAFITAVGENHLFRNDRGIFREVTSASGVAGAPDAWSTSSAFLDYDNDGDLDLLVANYVRWSREIDFEIGFQLTGIGRAYGPPTTFEGTHPYLYRNNGDGTFSDVSVDAGIQVNNPATGLPMAKGLAIAPIDVDGDGWLDVFLANDTVQNFLYHNQGDGSFREQGVTFGVAFDRNGAATGAMGADAAHYRNDNDLGLAVGNFANEMTSLYVAPGATTQFADEAITDGIGAASRLALTFGLFFFDYDLDGRLDLFQVNGHLEEDINIVQSSQHYAQPPQLFWNCGDRCRATFVPVPGTESGDLGKPLVGRGAAYGDIDGDGDLDIVLTQVGRRPVMLRNDNSLGNRWLRVKLIGRDVNRDGIGAKVEVTAGGITQRRQVMPTRSYLAQVELPLTFGLGRVDAVDRVRVIWPDGSIQEPDVIRPDSLVVVEQ